MIYIISTKTQSGRGGISTAAAGYAKAKAFDTDGIGFIVSHTGHRSKLLSILSAARVICTTLKKHDIAWLHCGQWFSMLRKLILGLCAKCKGSKVIFHFHADVTAKYLNNWLGRLFIAFLCRFADGVIVLSPWWESLFLSHFPWLKSRITVGPNPLDPQLLVSEQSKQYSPGQVKLLAMSRLVEGKGFEAAVRTLQHLPKEFHLSIAGTGPLEEEIRTLVDELNLKTRVSFLGWVDYSEKVRVISEHDIFFLPSRNDSFGMGFLEAMALGLPVVALNYGAVPDVVPDGKAGILVEQDTPEALAMAVRHCLENKNVYGQFGKNHVRDKFDREKLAENLIHFFKKL